MTSSPPGEAASGFVPHAALPHHLLSALMLALTRVRLPLWKNWQIGRFVRRYAVDMSQARQPDALAFEHFNAFFTRALREDARPLASEASALVSPADGVVSQAGRMQSGSLLQAKGRHYTVHDLLGGDPADAACFANGCFATVYLSPRDYHRVHMPVGGRLRRMVYVPGRLFSVSTATTAKVPRLFCRNERVVSLFDTEHGAVAVVLVGALFVGCMEQVWCGVVTPPRGHRSVTTDYGSGDAPRLERGDEMGRFNMGSTVIVLSERDDLQWQVAAGDSVVCRSAIAQFGS